MATVKCFIVGCSRSGTTLLSVMLDRHSQLAMTPETGFYGEIAPRLAETGPTGLERHLLEWYRLPELGLEPKTVVDHCGGNRAPGHVFEVILRLYAIRHGKPYCGEKTPGHWRHTESLLGDFPNAKIIFMIRDGRDAALSLAGMPWWPYDLSAAAAVWRGAAEAARAFLASYPTRVTVVRYEDIVSSPQTILAALMEFVELPFEPRQLDTDVVSHVVLPRSVQWKGRALGPIDQSRVGHWHSAARPQEASCLADALGAEMAFFGYH